MSDTYSTTCPDCGLDYQIGNWHLPTDCIARNTSGSREKERLPEHNYHGANGQDYCHRCEIDKQIAHQDARVMRRSDLSFQVQHLNTLAHPRGPVTQPYHEGDGMTMEPRQNDRDALATLIAAGLNEQAAGAAEFAPYVYDGRGIHDVVVDGHIDLFALADTILDACDVTAKNS